MVAPGDRSATEGEGKSCGSLNLVEIGISSVVSLRRSNSSESILKSVSIRLDGVDSDKYHDADSSNMSSLLTRTFLVEGLKNLF